MDTLLHSLNPSMMPLYLQITMGVMLILLLSFLGIFLGNGVVLWWRLHRLLAKLGQDEGDAHPDGIKPIFANYRKFRHLWNEYAETLHHERPQVTRVGQTAQSARWRATVPAEVYFNAEVVVDSTVGAEFFRHLPGVFTGIGIIGTFLGLIMGLTGFHPTSDPAETLKMIGPLIDSVHEAFLVSAVAISLAMLVTLVEKICITRWHALTEKLVHKLDNRFDAGVGEEYLARLTASSEKAASQASILKDQMVEQMGELLREISKEQAQTFQSSQQALAGDITQSIEGSLRQPLERMEQTFKSVTGGTGERTVEMLGDVMADFSERLKGLFGSQIQDLNALNRRSAEAMEGAAASMRRLVEELAAKSAEASSRMADNMGQAVRDMEQRQASINEQTQATLKDVAGTMQVMMDSMQESQERQLAASNERQAVWAQKTSTMVGGLGSQVDDAATQMASASSTMAETVQKMSATTASSIAKMDVGADKMVQAAQGMANAGDKLEDVLDKAAGLSEKLGNHAERLLDGTRAVEEVIADYQHQRQAVKELMEQAGVMIDGARKEASVTEDVLQRIDQSSRKLAGVHEDFETYLAGVTDVLEHSSKAFRESATTTLSEVNQQFHQDFSRAVRLLSASVDELEISLAALPGVN